MVWLDDFIRPRASRSSLDDSQLSDDGESLEGDNFNNHTPHDHDDDEEETYQRIDESLNMSPGVAGPTPGVTGTQFSGATNEVAQSSNPKTTPVIRKTVVAPKRKMTQATEVSQIDTEKLSFLKTINQRMEAREKKKPEDAEDRYSATIADKLRDLPQRERLMAKHEIENTLFKYQMQALDEKNNNNPRGNLFPLQQISIGMPDQTTQQQFLQNFQQQQQQQPMSPSYSATPSPSYPFQSNTDTNYDQS